MAGRPRKPFAVLQFEKKSHFTKKEMEEKRESEVSLGTLTFKIPEYISNDGNAKKKWDEVIGIFRASGLNLVTSSDVGNIGRYCKTFSEYHDLLAQRERVSLIESVDPDENEGAHKKIKDKLGARAAFKFFQKLKYLVSVGGLLQIDAAINKKNEILIKMEDRLFLNALAKIKNVAQKKTKKKADPLTEAGFGSI